MCADPPAPLDLTALAEVALPDFGDGGAQTAAVLEVVEAMLAEVGARATFGLFCRVERTPDASAWRAGCVVATYPDCSPPDPDRPGVNCGHPLFRYGLVDVVLAGGELWEGIEVGDPYLRPACRPR